jgi:hypothetical protein
MPTRRKPTAPDALDRALGPDPDLDSSPRSILDAASCSACGHVPVTGHRAVVWPAELLACSCPCHATWRAAWQLDG